jgi:branched-chain amino acid transport system permease protein
MRRRVKKLTDQIGWLSAARGLLLLCALALVAGPWLFSLNQQSLLTEFFTLVVMALMWNLLAGYADIITVGQHAFVGVGAYAFYAFAVLANVNAFIAIPLAALVTLVVAAPTMAIIFRLRTAYLAVGTWVAAEVMMLIAGKLPGFGGGPGASLRISVVKEFGANLPVRTETFYLMSLALAVVTFVATWALLRSRVGLGLTAMRDNEEAAGSAGVDLTRTRILCYLWTAPFLGLAGVLVTLQKLRVAPSASFSITDWTIYVIFIVVIGGIGSLEGPIIGTILFFLLREYLSGFGTWYLIILGAISIAVILIEPRGVWGACRRWRLPDLVPVTHLPDAPSASGSANPSPAARDLTPLGQALQATPAAFTSSAFGFLRHRPREFRGKPPRDVSRQVSGSSRPLSRS